VVPETVLLPNAAAILRDLSYMTARWHELAIPVVMEIRAFKEHCQPQIGKFSPEWLDEAVEWVENMNAKGYNLYAVRNPIRHDVKGSASDGDIVASFFLWADFDEPSSADNVRRWEGPKYSAAVTTGRIPGTRVHTYWRLAVPCTDMALWRDTQVAIAAQFGSDEKVVNPSRIMRIGGTVSYPAKHKQERGYTQELTTIRTEYDDERQPVTLDQMRRAFNATPPAKPAQPAQPTQPTQPTPNGFDVDVGAFQTLDRERATIQALSGVAWHDAVVRLVGSYVAKGLSDGEIHALTAPLTLSGYTADQTAREVQTAIDGARRKGWAPEVNQFREMSEAEIEAVPPALFKPWKTIDLTQIPYPDFIYSDFYARGYTSVTLAAPKVGKSMLGLVEAVDMACGWGLLTGVEREPQRVVYYNAEDDQNVINSRVAAILSLYGIPQSEIEDRLFPTSGVELDTFYMISGVEAVINEPLFVSIEKFCELNKADALIFDPLQDLSRSPETNEAFRTLGGRLRRMANKCNVALGLIHHTRKVAPGVSPSIDDMRGGSALRGTARFNRILVSMTEDEAAKAGVENHRHYFRIGDMESNLAPPSADVNRWFEKKSIETPNGRHVGAIKPWTWPDAFDGVSRLDAARVRSAIAAMSEPPRADIRSSKWAGNVVAQALNFDASTAAGKAKAKALLAKWTGTDVLRVEQGHDKRAGRPVDVVVAGDNNPLSEAQE